ncbi:MAG: hypothetical protein ABUS57_02580 [Pseudomonadota bacterium]
MSVGLILALLILLPGFAAYLAIFSIGEQRAFSVTPPPQNSGVGLFVLGAGALAAHTLSAIAFAINDWIADGHALFHMPFMPNVYALALLFETHPESTTGSDIAWMLGYNAALGVASYYLVSSYVQHWGRKRSAAMLYGWLTGVVEQSAQKDRYVTAFVVTKIQDGDAVVGYEGLLENLEVNSDKEVTAVTLLYATGFLLKIWQYGITRQVSQRRQPIPRIYLDRANISNIAFNVFESTNK